MSSGAQIVLACHPQKGVPVTPLEDPGNLALKCITTCSLWSFWRVCGGVREGGERRSWEEEVNGEGGEENEGGSVATPDVCSSALQCSTRIPLGQRASVRTLRFCAPLTQLSASPRPSSCRCVRHARSDFESIFRRGRFSSSTGIVNHHLFVVSALSMPLSNIQSRLCDFDPDRTTSSLDQLRYNFQHTELPRCILWCLLYIHLQSLHHIQHLKT